MKKSFRVLALLIALVLMVSNVFASVEGDIDGDGIVTSKDAAMVFNNPELGNGYSAKEILKKALNNDYELKKEETTESTTEEVTEAPTESTTEEEPDVLKLVDKDTSKENIYYGSTATFENKFGDDAEIVWYVVNEDDSTSQVIENANTNELFMGEDLIGKLVTVAIFKNGAKIIESDPIKIEVKNINIYTAYATVPILYSILNIYNDESESYIWYGRENTADSSKLPDYVTIMEPLGAAGATNSEKAINYVKEIIKANPYTHFNLFVDDFRIQNELMLFVYNGLSRDRYNVYLLPDGTATYSYFDRFLKDKTSALKNWNNTANHYEEAVENAKKGTLDSNYYKNNMYEWQCAYVASTLNNNVEYWVQWKEALVSEDDEVNKKLNFIEKTPYDMYNQLSEGKKTAFLNAVGVDKTEWDEKYFPENNKKYLIISGTSPNSEKNISTKFEDVVDQILNDFGDNYIYYYKPHPAYASSESRKEYFKSKGIIELPAQLPMEALIWAYPSVEIGGYNSTLYMSAIKGSVKFFIADSKENLDAVIASTYDKGLLGDVKFYPQKMNVEVSTVGNADDIISSEGAINVTFTDSDNNVATPISKTESSANQLVYTLVKKDYEVNVELNVDEDEIDKYNVTVDTTKVNSDAKIIVKIDLKEDNQ